MSSGCALSMNASLPVWQNIGFLYPFGNTPAKNLLNTCPVDLEKVSLLLLGCGDPRHVLYSSYCAEKSGKMAAEQKLSIVMCDIQAPIIARNVILMRLIFDGAADWIKWSLFYSKLID